MQAQIIPIIIYLISNLALVTPIQNETSPGEGGLVFTLPSSIKPNDDPENKLDIVRKAKGNEFSAEMITNKTRAMVSCETGEMLVRINFTEPFRGIAYADYDTSSPCKFFGEGGNYYEMKLPLKGCGTRQEAPRLFINNIILRFHRSLELEEDEEKTIVCRYPPPEAPAPPPPPGPPAQIVGQPLPEPAKLTQYEPFVILAGLLFFALLLAGVGTTSYLTRQQNIKTINTPLPINMQTEHDTYVDNQAIVTVEDIETTAKIVPFPQLSTQLVDDVFITNIHEIETVEDFVHHKQVIPRPHLERYDLEDTYITNRDEITKEDVLRQKQLAQMRRLNHIDCDDTYITNQDETIDEENLVDQKVSKNRAKLEVRTFEDTFITNVDEEIVEEEKTTYLKNREHQHEEREEYREGYRDC